MARITNGEQIALALQARLQRLNKGKKSSKKNLVDKPKSKIAGSSDPLREVVNQAGLDDQFLIQKVVKHLLEEELGGDFAQDYRFSKVVNHVSDIIRKDQTASTLLREVISELTDGK